MYHTTAPARSQRRRMIIPGLLAAAITVSSCVGPDASADDGQVCRLAQRLIDETADGDLDGIERQLDRLDDVDGIDDRTDLGELEDLTEIGDEDALDDIADQVDDDLDCDVDVPRIVEISESAPAATEPAPTQTPVTEPVVTEPPATTPPATQPPATEPPATAPPVTEAPAPLPPAAPAAEGQPLALVEIGADTVVGLDMVDIAQAPTALIAESGLTSLPVPAGEAVGVEYSVDYMVNDFSDAPEYTVRESATFVAATVQTIEQVRDAFSNAIIGATGVEYDLDESTASRDESTQSAVELRPDFGDGALRYEVIVVESTVTPGFVFIEITASGRRDGALPALPAVAAAQLGPAIGIGASLGWQLASWSWNPGINQFSGDQSTSGRLTWGIGAGTEADVAVKSAELLALLPAPRFEDVEGDRQFFIVNDNEDWSIHHSDAFEGAELRGSYSFTL